jgi:ankyrin repeat protein
MKQSNTETLQHRALTLMNTPEALARDKALLEAFFKEDIELVKSLLQPENGVRGANPNVKDEFGRTLYHLARRWGWKAMKSVLHRHGGRIICCKSGVNHHGKSKQLER